MIRSLGYKSPLLKAGLTLLTAIVVVAVIGFFATFGWGWLFILLTAGIGWWSVIRVVTRVMYTWDGEELVMTLPNRQTMRIPCGNIISTQAMQVPRHVSLLGIGVACIGDIQAIVTSRAQAIGLVLTDGRTVIVTPRNEKLREVLLGL